MRNSVFMDDFELSLEGNFYAGFILNNEKRCEFGLLRKIKTNKLNSSSELYFDYLSNTMISYDPKVTCLKISEEDYRFRKVILLVDISELGFEHLNQEDNEEEITLYTDALQKKYLEKNSNHKLLLVKED